MTAFWSWHRKDLCRRLILGGIDPNAIENLTKNHGPRDHEADFFDRFDNPDDGRTDSSPTSTIVNYRGRPYPTSSPLDDVKQHAVPESDTESEPFPESIMSNDRSSLEPNDSASAVATRHTYEQKARRTLYLSDLPPQTTPADVVAVVRGGLVVDIYFKFEENRAAVSFAHGEHAQKYYEYAQANGVCIRGSMIKVTWSNRQFSLTPYICQQLRGGASRNLVVRPYDRRITVDFPTANSIRADLEHIHNLSVINIMFEGLDCYIGTNSITAASFARTCMRSRLQYKGLRIEWARDECMQSLQSLQSLAQPKLKTWGHASMSQPKPNANRFSPLKAGGEGET